VVDTLEAKAATEDEVRRVAAAVGAGGGEPPLTTYVELPVADDPRALVTAVARAGLRAKVRTGGVTPDAFPTSAQLARFLVACAEAGVPFKATAGLHHPLRAAYRLTYAPDSATAPMFGFLNVFLAAALVRAGGSAADAQSLLEERDPGALELDDDAVIWRGHRLTAARLADARGAVVSFGSCSFTEPMEELRLLRGADRDELRGA
jgi:hypothetical protein